MSTDCHYLAILIVECPQRQITRCMYRMKNASHFTCNGNVRCSVRAEKGDQEMQKAIVFVLLLSIFPLAGCAFDLAHVSFTPTPFASRTDTNRSFTLRETINITSAPCYRRTLRQDTKWDLVGTISEGEVYKSRDQVMTVECSNIHEAYLVISEGSLVGFYLPVEKGFVKISDSIKLPMK